MRYKTKEVAEMLARPYHQVYQLVQKGLIMVEMDYSKDLSWKPRDVRRARMLLNAKKKQKPGRIPRGVATVGSLWLDAPISK